jgi:CBS domain-containing protein
MSILMFDPKAEIYLPADKLFIEAGVKQMAATNPTARISSDTPHAPQREQQTRDLYRAYGQGQPHEPEPAMLARQIMVSPVLTLRQDAPLGEARRMFREHRFRHIPILSADDKLVGILSDRDLLAHANDPAQASIQPLINPRVLVATPETEIREIAGILFEQHIGAMPIINSSETLVGIVTRSDILRVLRNRAPLELWI